MDSNVDVNGCQWTATSMSMDLNGPQRIPIAFNEFQFVSMNCKWVSIGSNGVQRVAMDFNESQRISMDGSRWIPMDCNKFQVMSIDVNGFQRISGSRLISTVLNGIR